jgi:hypothetical protein
MANTTRTSRVNVVTGNAIVAELVAGKIIVPPDASRAYIIVGGWMRALGGSAATATSVDIKDTATVAVVGVAVGVAALTQDTVADFDAATNVVWTTYGTALTKGKGLKIMQTTAAGPLATCTSVDYCVKYMTV